jgi:hypothetical protein
VVTTAMYNNWRPDIQDLPSRTSNHRTDSLPTNCPDCTLHLRGQSSMQHSSGSSNRFQCLSSAVWECCRKLGMVVAVKQEGRRVMKQEGRRVVRNNREDCKDCCLVGTPIRRNGCPANMSSYYRRYQQDTPSRHMRNHCLSSMGWVCPSKMIHTMPLLRRK